MNILNDDRKKILISKHDVLMIEGKLSYNERFQAWNTIRFKTDFIREFPQLMEKRSHFYYSLAYYRNFKSLEKAIKDISKKEILPVLLFFYKKTDS